MVIVEPKNGFCPQITPQSLVDRPVEGDGVLCLIAEFRIKA